MVLNIRLLLSRSHRYTLVIPLLFLILCAGTHSEYVVLDRSGCGITKGCLFKPAGCDPNLDCTIGIIFYVSGPNKLTVQLVAQSLLPMPALQYVAIGFSKDAHMGDDFVSECVLNPSAAQSSFGDVEVYASYNHGKSNDRTYLNTTERSTLYENIDGGVVDGRITCQFTQQLRPQMNSKNGLLVNLDMQYYVLGATGSSQHDEINVHDLTFGSHFYPIVSPRAVNPSLIGPNIYPLPPPHHDFNRRTKLNDAATISLNASINRVTVKSRAYVPSAAPSATQIHLLAAVAPWISALAAAYLLRR